MSGQPSNAFDPSGFPALISGLGAQSQIVMGLLENPLTHRKEPCDLNKAAMIINTLDMLKTKTQGNLDGNEQKFLDTILTDLRMRFVELKKSES